MLCYGNLFLLSFFLVVMCGNSKNFLTSTEDLTESIKSRVANFKNSIVIKKDDILKSNLEIKDIKPLENSTTHSIKNPVSNSSITLTENTLQKSSLRDSLTDNMLMLNSQSSIESPIPNTNYDEENEQVNHVFESESSQNQHSFINSTDNLVPSHSKNWKRYKDFEKYLGEYNLEYDYKYFNRTKRGGDCYPNDVDNIMDSNEDFEIDFASRRKRVSSNLNSENISKRALKIYKRDVPEYGYVSKETHSNFHSNHQPRLKIDAKKQKDSLGVCDCSCKVGSTIIKRKFNVGKDLSLSLSLETQPYLDKRHVNENGNGISRFFKRSPMSALKHLEEQYVAKSSKSDDADDDDGGDDSDSGKKCNDEDIIIKKLAKALIAELNGIKKEGCGDSETEDPECKVCAGGGGCTETTEKPSEETTPFNMGTVKPSNQIFVEPGIPCDYFDDETQSCWYDRQVGETLTITLRLKDDNGVYLNMEERDFDIKWQRRFKIHNEKRVIVVNLAQDQTPWNIVLGSGGAELRFSPLTDSDMDYNSFRVEVVDLGKGKAGAADKPKVKKGIFRMMKRESGDSNLLAEITFRVNIIPIDMGPMFPGEETLINIENYISLPFDAICFEWLFERVDSSALTLPSNMKVSSSGRSLSIKELRQNQHGILECAMYSSKGMFIAKRRFAIHLPKENLCDSRHAKRSVEKVPDDDISEKKVQESNQVLMNLKNQDDLKMKIPNSKISMVTTFINMNQSQFITNDPILKLNDENDFGNSNNPHSYKKRWGGTTSNVASTTSCPSSSIPGSSGSSLPTNAGSSTPITTASGNSVMTGSIGGESPASLFFANEIVTEIQIDLNGKFSEARPSQAPVTKAEGDQNDEVHEFDEESDLLEDDKQEFPELMEPDTSEEDFKEEYIMTKCTTKNDCNTHASCVECGKENKGFCHCNQGYHGNGMFCWETMC